MINTAWRRLINTPQYGDDSGKLITENTHTRHAARGYAGRPPRFTGARRMSVIVRRLYAPGAVADE